MLGDSRQTELRRFHYIDFEGNITLVALTFLCNMLSLLRLD